MQKFQFFCINKSFKAELHSGPDWYSHVSILLYQQVIQSLIAIYYKNNVEVSILLYQQVIQSCCTVVRSTLLLFSFNSFVSTSHSKPLSRQRGEINYASFNSFVSTSHSKKKEPKMKTLSQQGFNSFVSTSHSKKKPKIKTQE